MDKLKIVFLDNDTLPNSIKFPQLDIPHQISFYNNTSKEQVADRIKGCDVVITNKVHITAEHIKNSNLKMIAVAATGCDNIDIKACEQQNVVVSNVVNYAVNSVPEHTLALILSLQRNLAAYKESIKQGRWLESGNFCYFDFPIKDLSGATIAIIGNGSLGQSVAKLAQAFGLKVKFINRASYSNYVDAKTTEFEQILQTSDIISLHCPLTAETKDLIGAREFELMSKRKPLLINTARGGLVNEAELVNAIKNGLISGAGFDVVSKEPMPADHPFNSIMDYPNFILTPHVAWSSFNAISNLVSQVKNNIESFYAGNPCNVVTSN